MQVLRQSSWEAGTLNAITWESSGYVFNVNIYYSVNGGATYSLVTQEANDGTYMWRTNISPTSETKIKIADVSAPSISSESMDVFSVVDTTGPVVTVESPSGGDVATGGGTYEVLWNAVDAVSLKPNPITIYFSSNEGMSWSLITGEIPNSGSYIWQVPQINSTGCIISVEAEDLYSNIGRGINQGNFTIEYNPVKPAVSFEVTLPSLGIIENKTFLATVEALDINGNKTSGVYQNISVLLNDGTASPETISYLEFSDGEWTGNLSVSKALPDKSPKSHTIRATS